MAWYYYAGGVAALAGLALIAKGGSGQAQSKDSGGDAAASPQGTPMSAPLFMASGGGSSQSATNDLPLGGSTWKPPTVPIGDNPDVAIAKINAEVNLAAINAAERLQTAAINQTQQPNTTASKTEYRGSNIAEGAAYIKSITAQTPQLGFAAVENNIYQKAKAYGFSPTEVAQSFTAATGQKVTPDDVNNWLAARGLSL